MYIHYLKDGTIIELSEDFQEKQTDSIELDSKDLPKDFMQTFALGRYVVKDKKIKRTRKKLKVPDKELMAELLYMPENDEIKKLLSPKKKTAKQKKKKS